MPQIPDPVLYLSASEIGRLIGASSNDLTTLRRWHPIDLAPAVKIGPLPGWRESSLPLWRKHWTSLKATRGERASRWIAATEAFESKAE